MSRPDVRARRSSPSSAPSRSRGPAPRPAASRGCSSRIHCCAAASSLVRRREAAACRRSAWGLRSRRSACARPPRLWKHEPAQLRDRSSPSARATSARRRRAPAARAPSSCSTCERRSASPAETPAPEEDDVLGAPPRDLGRAARASRPLLLLLRLVRVLALLLARPAPPRRSSRRGDSASFTASWWRSHRSPTRWISAICVSSSRPRSIKPAIDERGALVALRRDGVDAADPGRALGVDPERALAQLVGREAQDLGAS